MLGLVESSRSDRKNPAQGLDEQLEITDLFTRLPTLPGWDPNPLAVTFEPKYLNNIKVQVARLTVSMTRR